MGAGDLIDVQWPASRKSSSSEYDSGPFQRLITSLVWGGTVSSRSVSVTERSPIYSRLGMRSRLPVGSRSSRPPEAEGMESERSRRRREGLSLPLSWRA